MSRPTISLAMIAKNERHNLPRLLASVTECFDEIHITDTGSTDGTVDFLQSKEAEKLAGCPIYVHHFTWVHDFAAARNASFSHVKTDYAAWMDCDDVLSDREAFIHFRDKVMNTADYWLATYHYAFDPKGNPICSFLRERVVNIKKGFVWKYFVHEGLLQKEPGILRAQQVQSWNIKHLRTDADVQADKSRNLDLFEQHQRTTGLCPRMTYYYGKELFDARKFMEAGAKLLEASKLEGLEPHDRIMALQYATGAALECGQNQTAIQIALQGVNLAPNRAEFWTLLGDAHIRQGKVVEAEPFYQAARCCKSNTNGGLVSLSIDAYERYPTEQIASIAINTGDLAKAEIEVMRLAKTSPERAQVLSGEIAKIVSMVSVPVNAKPCNDIIITCPPMNGPKQNWDDVMHEQVGLGGSETAAVELSEFWQQKTGRQVIIFNNRTSDHRSKSGVLYKSVKDLPNYLKENMPFIHIAWRHSTRLTQAPSYLWCHDLFTPGAEKLDYDKILCLSDFHKNYVKALQNIPSDKVMLMKNGIEPKHFKQDHEKNPNKIIFPSSPDRGLDRSINIIKLAREKTGRDLELHVFYGFENMRAMGWHEMADRLEGMMKANPWVKYHGNVKKDVLAKHFLESAVWLYPADFIETFCITALEAAAGGCYSIIRNFGGVVDTAMPFVNKGMAEIIDCDALTDKELDLWSNRLADAILKEKWLNVDIDAESVSWETVANEWIEKLNLKLG